MPVETFHLRDAEKRIEEMSQFECNTEAGKGNLTGQNLSTTNIKLRYHFHPMGSLFEPTYPGDAGAAPRKQPGGGKAIRILVASNLGRVKEKERGCKMLWTVFVVLLILWLLGLVSSYTLGGFIHILLVLALVVLVINLLSGRRTVV